MGTVTPTAVYLQVCTVCVFRHHRSNDDCPEGKRVNYQVCSLQYSQCN